MKFNNNIPLVENIGLQKNFHNTNKKIQNFEFTILFFYMYGDIFSGETYEYP